jgi:hypothetical protein
MKLADLKVAAIALEIVLNGDEKKWVILETILQKLANQRTDNKVESTTTTAKQDEVIKNSSMSRSDKIRFLHDEGFKNNAISDLLGAHYSFVHGVVQKYETSKQIKALTAVEVAEIVESEKTSKEPGGDAPFYEELDHPVVGEVAPVETAPVKQKRTKAKTAAEKVLEAVYA